MPLKAAFRTCLLLVAMLQEVGATDAPPLRLTGAVGFLQEWELAGNLTESVSGSVKEFSGPLTMKHIGLCTQSGPQEKTADIRLRITTRLVLSSRIDATLIVDGATCTFDGPVSDSFSGFLNCPTAKVPLKFSIR